MKRPSIFDKPLGSTLIGWLIFAFLLPGIALWNGIGGLIAGEISIRGAEVLGMPARLYALGMIFFGLGTLAVPRFHEEYSTFHATRLLAGGVLFAVLIVAGSIGLLF